MSAMISLEREVSLGKTVLDDLFYLFALREKAARDASYLTAVTFEQLLECRLVGAGSSDQRIICPLCERRHQPSPILHTKSNAVFSAAIRIH
jgi:hypothetical protein